jgi:thiol-disulfide isomerase/thioredoxin
MSRFVFSCIIGMAITVGAASQPLYSFEPDPKSPGQMLLWGAPTKYVLMNDASFSWYASNQKGYAPSVAWLGKLEKAKDSLSFIVFAGTWCDDSQFIIPRFFRLLELAGIRDGRVTFYAVDRNKKTPDQMADLYKIERVPTMILMKNGRELGRVVEYGTTGRWDEELVGLIK